jgi:serine/threonine protein kinase/Flp pilus assembly protein TadD
MGEQDSSLDYNLLDRLVEEFNDRFRRGERPSVREYCERYPQLADDLRDLLPAMAQVEQAKEEFAETKENAPPSAPAIRNLGDFHILREVGHGGMGVVYEAEQVSLGRRVALKVLTDRLMQDARQKRRFDREAKAAARLHHTNIVPVFGTGEASGVPYYVMQFIQGMGLDVVIEELARMAPETGLPVAVPLSSTKDVPAVRREASLIARSLMTGEFCPASAAEEPGEELEGTLTHAGLDRAPAQPPAAVTVLSPSEGTHRLADTSGATSSVTLPGQNTSGGKARKLTYWQSAARIGVQVADALAYAHAQGVIHRDIKPSNLLLDLAGTVWVTDFGLAKAEGSDNLTHTGDVIGTLRYMPPEAFDGRADARGDVYALGLSLYELAALRPAFAERERNRLIKQVTTTEATPVGRVRKGVPRDLETIIHKAIDRDPARRYQTAAALRDDLQRFVDDEPILARRQSNWERARRWCRHNPAVAALIAFIALLMVGVTAASLVAAAYFDRTAREERTAREAAQQAEDAALKAKQQAKASYDRARRAVDESFRKVSESQLLKVPGLQPLRAELLQSALGFYDDFLKEGADDPALRADAAAIHVRIGRVLTDLGQEKEARAAIDRGIEAYEAAANADPESLDLKAGLMDAWAAYGELYYWKNNKPESSKGYQNASKWGEILVKARPDNPADKRNLAKVLNGFAIETQGPEQIAAHRRCLELREELLQTTPDDPELLHAVGESLGNIAILMKNGPGNNAERLRTQLLANSYTERAVRSFPSSIEYGTDLAMGYTNAAYSYSALGEGAAAIATYRKSITHLEAMARANPTSPEVRTRLYGARFGLVQLFGALKEPDEAAKFCKETVDELARLPTDTAEELFETACSRAYCLRYQRWMVNARLNEEAARLKNLARDALRDYLTSESANPARLEADADLRALLHGPEGKALLELSRRQQASKTQPKSTRPATDHRPAMAAGYLALGHIEADSGQFAEARQSLGRALQVQKALAAEHPHDPGAAADMADIQFALGDLEWKAGHPDRGVKAWQDSVDALAAAYGTSPKNSPERHRLIEAFRKLGDRYASRALWGEAAAAYDQAVAAGSRYVWDSVRAGQCYFAVGDTASYRRHCRLAWQQFGGSKGFWTQKEWDANGVLILHAMDPDAAPNPATLGLTAMAAQLRMGTWWQIMPGVWLVSVGQYDAAIRLLAPPIYTDATLGSAWGAAALAVAHHRLGHTDEARWWLSRTRALNDDWMRRFLSHDPLSQWWGQVEHAAAYRWAATVVTGTPPPTDVREQVYRSRMYAGLGKQQKADAEFAAAVKTDAPRAWLTLGEHLREAGDAKGAEHAFTQAATLAPDQLDRFLNLRWWTAGAFIAPFDLALPAEVDPDPTRPIARLSGPQKVTWRFDTLRQPDGILLLPPAVTVQKVRFSSYGMTDIYSPSERTSGLAMAGDGPIRVWLNGQLVYEASKPPSLTWDHVAPLTPIVLKAGRNRLLVRTAGSTDKSCDVTIRLADHPFDQARLFAAAGLWPEAAHAIEKLVPYQPENNFLGSLQVKFLHAVGKHDAARSAFNRRYTQYAETTNAYLANDLLRAEVVIPGFRSAYPRLARLVEKGWLDKSDRPPWLLCDVGLGYLRAEEWENADRLLNECLKKAVYPPCWPGLALVHHHRGQREQAIALVRKAENWWAEAVTTRLQWRDPSLPMEGLYVPSFLALLDEARAALRIQPGPAPDFAGLQDRFRKRFAGLDPATAWFDRVLLYWPSQPRLHLARAVRLAALHRGAEANADFAKAVPADSKDPELWLARGRVYAELGRDDEAAADFERYLDLLAPDGTRMLKLVRLLRYPEVFARLLARRPRDTDLVICRARDEFQAGHWAEAAAHYQCVIKQRGGNAGAFEAAAAYLLVGDRPAFDDLYRWLSEQNRQKPDRFTAYELARAGALADPPGAPAEELRAVAEQARQRWPVGWVIHTQGLAALAAGDWEGALGRFAESDRTGWLPGMNQLGTAIAQAHLKRPEDARKSVAEGVYKLLGDHASGDPLPRWFVLYPDDWAEMVLLRREAERLLERNALGQDQH